MSPPIPPLKSIRKAPGHWDQAVGILKDFKPFSPRNHRNKQGNRQTKVNININIKETGKDLYIRPGKITYVRTGCAPNYKFPEAATGVVHEKRCSKKFRKNHRKTRVPEPLL